ncbi:hypothetical protein PsAD2_03762 [Pseudovibrio axinellae]|uniref:Uncharacterized protein n=1 Tax=Pseudovibrio axinellae TaxID=989403 RepID=A0A165VL18_9HYPH|nr:hypothetical protein [Pseudovibrio axinellae]KZL14358.1 hypothetical protein PsAD2_03762 [Pseudovibrio axinellae]SER89718.1 hypothetical protein SAMN05421798_1543 [Pseudovibrio axinellae]
MINSKNIKKHEKLRYSLEKFGIKDYYVIATERIEFINEYSSSVLFYGDNDYIEVFGVEQGEISDICKFKNEEDALNYFFWSLTQFESEAKTYYSVYEEVKPEKKLPDELSIQENIEMLNVALEVKNIPLHRYKITNSDNYFDMNGLVLLCGRQDEKFAVFKMNSGFKEEIAIFDDFEEASDFVFWTLTSAKTYIQVYNEDHS